LHRLGKKTVLVYFGEISDRINQIASTEADVLFMETSMKNFVKPCKYVFVYRVLLLDRRIYRIAYTPAY